METANIKSLSVMNASELQEINGGFVFGPSVALFVVGMLNSVNTMYVDFKQGLDDGYNKRLHSQ